MNINGIEYVALSGRNVQQPNPTYLQGSSSGGATSAGVGTAATMAVPFSVDFTVQGTGSPAFVITPQVFDAAGNQVTNYPSGNLFQTDVWPLALVTTISALGDSYHIELPGGWSFNANITAFTTGTGKAITVPATVEVI